MNSNKDMYSGGRLERQLEVQLPHELKYPQGGPSSSCARSFGLKICQQMLKIIKIIKHAENVFQTSPQFGLGSEPILKTYQDQYI